MSKQRWTKDETILVLKAYLSGDVKPSPKDPRVVKLAGRVPHSADSVVMLLQNFRYLDPTQEGGLPNVSKPTRRAWKCFAE